MKKKIRFLFKFIKKKFFFFQISTHLDENQLLKKIRAIIKNFDMESVQILFDKIRKKCIN